MTPFALGFATATATATACLWLATRLCHWRRCRSRPRQEPDRDSGCTGWLQEPGVAQRLRASSPMDAAEAGYWRGRDDERSSLCHCVTYQSSPRQEPERCGSFHANPSGGWDCSCSLPNGHAGSHAIRALRDGEMVNVAGWPQDRKADAK